MINSQIICPQCGQLFAPDGYTIRPIDDHPKLQNYGMACPHCEWFGHLFVEDDRMRRYRATLVGKRDEYNRRKTPGHWRAVEKARVAFGRVFDETQAKWRPALGLVPVFQGDTEAEVAG